MTALTATAAILAPAFGTEAAPEVPVAPPAVGPVTLSHVATMTADLDRYRAFYEGVLGLRTAIVLRLDHEPFLRHAFLFLDDRTVLHAFEVPGYDPLADGVGTEIGHRGRLDHFGLLMPDRAAFEAARERLVAAGASDGTVTPFGPMLSVHFRDPDGLEGEVNALIEAFDPADMSADEVIEVPDPAWFDRLRGALAPTRGGQSVASRGKP